MGTQWQRIDYADAPKGHALTAKIQGQSWRAFELDDGRWRVELLSPPFGATIVDSLAQVRRLAEPQRNPAMRRRSSSTRRRRKRNGAGVGAFLGSLLGALGGFVVGSIPGAVVGSVAGGAVGGAVGAPADRRRRGATGGALGGLLSPVGAGVGGYLAGQEPDADFTIEGTRALPGRTANPQYDPQEWAQFVLDGLAQRDAQMTDELIAAANAFEEAVDEALEHCFAKHKPAGDVTLLYGSPQTALDVYATLAGEGFGIWDGRWDRYYPNARRRLWMHLETCLRSDLASSYARLEAALADAAFATEHNRQRYERRLANRLRI